MDQETLDRLLRPYSRVRDSKYYNVAVRRAPRTPLLEEGTGKRSPKVTSKTTPVADSTDSVPASSVASQDFFKQFDAWVASKGLDRPTTTKVQVGFRKEHRALLASMCLEDIEEIATQL